MKKRVIILGIAGSLLFTSCDVISGLFSQVASVANLINCEYSLKNVDHVTVAGVNVKDITKGNINATDVVMLTSALLSKNIPLAMDMNINVKNPTNNVASLTNMDWALDIESSQFATGTVNKHYSIGAKKTSVVPLNVGTDLYSLFSQKGIESLKSFASSFTDKGTSSKVGVRIKPSLQVAGQTFKAPNFINITKNVGGSTASSTQNSNSQSLKQSTKKTTLNDMKNKSGK